MNSSITKGADLPQAPAADQGAPGSAASADARPAAVLRGSARGLEIVVDGGASIDAIAAAICTRIAEAPAFFRGSDVRVRVEDGPLATGCLARLDDIAARFDLRIVEIGAARKKGAAVDEAVPQLPTLALGSAAAPAPAVEVAPAPAPLVEVAPAPLPVIAVPPVVVPTPTPVELPLEDAPGTRLLVGPVRSGVVLAHDGHLIIFGDVNPGAEVRATGNIVVLGRLRGTAHAGIGSDVGFILALRLEPQQLRICRLVARAGDSDTPSNEAELAHATGGTIVVERYLGKLPRSLADSLS
jgi:septum site-determining protein MinC